MSNVGLPNERMVVLQNDKPEFFVINLLSPRMNYMDNFEASEIVVAGVCCGANLKCKNLQTLTA